MPIVYMATNLVNGKRYIGLTSGTLVHRRSSHIWEARHRVNECPRFHNAIRKYGPAAFNWSVLLVCESREEVIQEEIRLIAELKPEYNISIGGDGAFGLKHTDAWKAAKSASMRGKKLSAKHAAALRASNVGRSPSAETRQKIKAAMLGRKFTPEWREKLSVAQRLRFQREAARHG